MPDVVARPAPKLTHHRLVRAGVFAWSVIGFLVLVVVALTVLGTVRLVVVPLVIALFPAALLSPLAEALKRRGAAPALAAAAVLVGFLVGLVALLAALVWLIVDELGDIAVTVEEAWGDVREWVAGRFGRDLPRFDEMVDQAQAWLGNVGSDATAVASTTVEVVGGVLLGIVALFFYLKDGDRFLRFALQLTPERRRDDVHELAQRVWATLGGYFRGQLIVAAVDAVFIGLGLLLLGVPLALPLALLVFFGGLFPIVGAFTAGGVAVLVALADGGLGLALIVLVLNVAVQQLEGNLLEPIIVGRATALHPLAVLAALTAGAVTLGILGAFLAVPVVASLVRVASFALARQPSLDVETPEPAPATT